MDAKMASILQKREQGGLQRRQYGIFGVL